MEKTVPFCYTFFNDPEAIAPREHGASTSAGAAEPRPQNAISLCSGVWVPPPKYRDTEAAKRAD
jgi:hypothetical protein